MTTLTLLTGASRGLGAALARTAPDGPVVGYSRGAGDLEDIDRAEHVAADLADPSAWGRVTDDLARRIAAADGDVAFVHAAGTLTPIGFAGEVDLAAYTDAVLLGSAAGQVLGAAVLGALAEHPGRHHVVHVTSGAAGTVYEGWSAYGAGKAALDQWTRVVGAERERRGGTVRVLAVSPGVVDTAMQDEIRATDPDRFPQREKFERLHDEGSLVDPDDAARRLWRLVLDGDHDNGAVLDLRDRA